MCGCDEVDVNASHTRLDGGAHAIPDPDAERDTRGREWLSRCADRHITKARTRPGATAHTSTDDASSTSTVRWNRRAIPLFRVRGGEVGRVNAYLSIAQYRAVLAAHDERRGRSRPSATGAAAGASVVVLKQFYPLDASAIDASLEVRRGLE